MRLILLVSALAIPGASYGGAIERACNASDRQAATHALCSCIQEAADATLTDAEQRKAAKFFKDPDQAQETRQSDASSNERFWQRYKNFGAMAEAWCAPTEVAG